MLGICLGLAAWPAPAAESRSAETADAESRALDPKDPAEQEFKKIMAQDDAAQEEVDRWIRENAEFSAKGAGTPAPDLNRRIKERLEPVKKAYEEFLAHHPNHTRARVAYASFLGDTRDEEGAQVQLEKALQLDTNNAAIYNNLANIYGHIGSTKKAFEFYAKAIALNPTEPVYYHNFGTTVYLFRRDAEEYYHLSEDQVFAKTFQLYSNAMRLDPQDFPLASDVAQTYYGIKPLRTEDALRAWTNALNIARDAVEREGVQVHFARIKCLAGRFAEAKAHLNSVTNAMYAELKKRVARNIQEKEGASQTNALQDTTSGPNSSASVATPGNAPQSK